MALINMGCGDQPAPYPWTNCDSWPALDPDVICDATKKWPFPTSSAGRVFLGQVLEHLPYPWGVRAALREAHRVLEVGGQLCVITPDFVAMKEKKVPAEVWRAEAVGMRRWPGDQHLWMPSRHVVVREVERRFGNAAVVNHLNLDEMWPLGSRNPWDCCVTAEKIGPPAFA
jgi:predicted SAM-dependent methyltransferase